MGITIEEVNFVPTIEKMVFLLDSRRYSGTTERYESPSFGGVAALAKVGKEWPGKSPYSVTTAKPNIADRNRDEELAR
jgi:hypothetical protein